MATQRKRKGAAKRPIRRKERPQSPPPKTFQPAPASLEAPTPAPKGRNGLLLTALILLAVGTVLWRQRKEEQPAAPPASAIQAPEARRVAPTQAPKSEAVIAKGAPRRATAGESETPPLTFDRSRGGTLSVRCWRPEGGTASLDIFGPRNRRMRRLESPAGEAGWVTLDWDGKDDAGKAVPEGLYWLRPSTQGVQQLRDVWVKG